jgi:hypothetical protein
VTELNLAEQLALDVDEDDVTWDEWFRSLPVTPGSECTVGDRVDALEEASAG